MPLSVSVDRLLSLCLYCSSTLNALISTWVNNLLTCTRRLWWSSILTLEAMLSWTILHLSSHRSWRLSVQKHMNFASYFIDSYFHLTHYVKIEGRKLNHIFLLPIDWRDNITLGGTPSMHSYSSSNINSRKHSGNISSSSRASSLSWRVDTTSCL